MEASQMVADVLGNKMEIAAAIELGTDNERERRTEERDDKGRLMEELHAVAEEEGIETGMDDGTWNGKGRGKSAEYGGEVLVIGIHDRARKRRLRRLALKGQAGGETDGKVMGVMDGAPQGNLLGDTGEGRPEGVPDGHRPGQKDSSPDEQPDSLPDGLLDGLLDGRHLGYKGLDPPTLENGQRIDGSNKAQLRRENKRKRIQKQELQHEQSYWTEYKGDFEIPEAKEGIQEWSGGMCPSGLALHHPAAAALLEYATQGCPCNTGKDWTKEQVAAAVLKGPHKSALEPDAIEQMEQEIKEKERQGQVKVVLWDDIKDNPPKQLKISPVAMIPHKSRKYRAILDLSFPVRLKNEDGTTVEAPSVNDSTTLEAPAGAIDQLGHSLERIIHAFAEAPDDAKIFMAKFDIKDGFWRLNARQGYEWNFAYVLPQREGEPTKLVIPLSLQMGWVESPPYFCAASETARDVAVQLTEATLGSQDDNKFVDYAMGNMAVQALPEDTDGDLRYFVDVYVDDFLSMAIATSRRQVRHCANAVMNGIHSVFPEEDGNDPISEKKLKKKEGEYALLKDMLGFIFDGEEKTMQLDAEKRAMLLAVLHKWIRSAKRKTAGIEFKEFESVIYKIRHCFRSIPAGRGLMTPCNNIIGLRPARVYLHRNKKLTTALKDMRTLIREATAEPTKCKELVMGHPDHVGVKDASLHGVGGVIVGEGKACIPTVFRVEWPQWVKDEVLKTNGRKKGDLTNSDLEMAGLVLLWLIMEEVCSFEPGDHVALFSDNSPTVSWTNRLACRNSKVADQLIRALALRLKKKKVSPLSTLHIAGEKNAMTDIPSRSFGSEPKWFCKTDEELLTLFNSKFPLKQNTWTVFRPSQKIISRIFSVLQMKVLKMEEWTRLPKPGRHIGTAGEATAKLWEWTLTFREKISSPSAEQSNHSQLECGQGDSAEDAKLELEQFRRRSRPLIRRSPWPSTSNHSK